MNVDMIGQYIVFPILSISMLMGFARLWIGPGTPDRVVALDLLMSLGIGLIVYFAIHTGNSVFLDVATVVALISFLGTIGFAYYVQEKDVLEVDKGAEEE